MTDEWPVRMSVREILEFIVTRNGGKRIEQLSLIRSKDDNWDDDDYHAIWFYDEDAKLYEDAADELLDAILGNRLHIFGQRAGRAGAPLEVVAPEEFTELRSSMLGETSIELILGERRYLNLVDGSIRNRREVFWIGLIAKRDDVIQLLRCQDRVELSTAREPSSWELDGAINVFAGGIIYTDPEYDARTGQLLSRSSIARKPSKTDALVAWLEKTYPKRPSKTVDELMKEAKQQAPEIGAFSKGTFEKAMSRCYRLKP